LTAFRLLFSFFQQSRLFLALCKAGLPLGFSFPDQFLKEDLIVLRSGDGVSPNALLLNTESMPFPVSAEFNFLVFFPWVCLLDLLLTPSSCQFSWDHRRGFVRSFFFSYMSAGLFFLLCLIGSRASRQPPSPRLADFALVTSPSVCPAPFRYPFIFGSIYFSSKKRHLFQSRLKVFPFCSFPAFVLEDSLSYVTSVMNALILPPSKRPFRPPA